MVKPSETPNTAPKASKLSLAGAATSKKNFCRDKSLVATNTCLSRQNTCLSRQNTTFVATKVCLSRSVATKVLLRQAYFVATKDVFCRDKHMFKHVFVATKMIQNSINNFLLLFPLVTISKLQNNNRKLNLTRLDVLGHHL